MSSLIHSTRLETIECCRCGGALALSASWIKSARDIGGFRMQFYCPYCGNQQGWGVSQAEKTKERFRLEIETLSKQNQNLRESRESALAEADHFRRSRDGMKGALNKVKKRVSHGTCPCCNRTFKQLAAHMANKHPEYSTPDKP